MNRSEATVESLTGLLPDLAELEILRLRLVGVAVPDPGKEWDSSRYLTTIDKRIVTLDAALRALDDAEEVLKAFIASLHQGLRPVLQSHFEDDPDATARHLITLGESLEDSGRIHSAERCYGAALQVSLPLPEKGPQILALRRIARVALNLGDFERAALHYGRSAELARDSGDLPGEVIALTGAGNIRLWQSRFGEAETWYQEALALADTAAPGTLARERGQIYNNLANLTTRQGRLDQSELWFESAFRQWETVSSPVDLAICHFNHALLRQEQDRWDEARRDYDAALALPIPSSLRAVIASDYAEWWIRAGHVTQAEEWGRVAEEHAIAAQSPYSLARMYHGRGNLARARKEEDGFIFFEKSLEIAREKGYLFAEAEALVDYAQLRGTNGGAEEAVAYLERACEIFREVGALGQLERAQRARAELAPAAAAAIIEFPTAEILPEEPEPPRLAATGD